MDIGVIVQILESTLRLATPLLFACLAGLFSERAGIFDIGLEGKLLIAAFFSAAVSAYFAVNPLYSYETTVCQPGTDDCMLVVHEVFSPVAPVLLGLVAGVTASVALALLHGLTSITFRGNQLISGVAINFLAAGLTVVIAQGWFGQGGRTPSLSGDARFQRIELPLADVLRDVPVAGQVYSTILSGHPALVYVGLLCVPLTWWILYRSRFGLRLRAVGENPAAVDTAGISVIRMRYAAVIICGVLCGLGGVYLATALSAGFVKDMSAGRGFIALAALIFAKWRPWHALGAVLLFGMLEAIANRFPNIDLGIVTLPSQFMAALPYILTVVILAGFVGRAIPPRAGGEPYVKER